MSHHHRVCTLSVVLGVAVATLTAGSGFGQETPSQQEIDKLVEELRDAKFEVREQAMRKLIDIGHAAVPALERAARDDDAEVAYRAKRALREITVIEPAEQARLRAVGERALYAGDNAEMIRVFRRLGAAANSSFDDQRSLGHAYQLGGKWKEAAAAYRAALEMVDKQLDGGAARDAAPGDTAVSRDVLLRRRIALILVLGRIYSRLLDDPETAAKTYALAARHSKILTTPLDQLVDRWKSILADAASSGESVDSMRRKAGADEELYYPLFALRELADVQERLGRRAEALATRRRTFLTQLSYLGNPNTAELVAMDRLLSQTDDSDAGIGAVVIHEDEPTITFDLTDPDSLAKAYANYNAYWTYCLAPPAGKEFATLQFDCDIEQFELRYGGQFEAWTMIGDEDSRRMNLGSVHWPVEQKLGRAVRSLTIELEPGIGALHFKAGSWKGKFQVHSVKATATFRDRAAGEVRPQPVPGYVIQNECLPKGGSLTLDGEPYQTSVASHGVKPGRRVYAYTHPERSKALSYEAKFQPGAYYGMFINLDSPLESKLTTLRRIADLSSSLVQREDGSWLAAWQSERGEFELATSKDLVTWSKPWSLPESGLYGGPYTCRTPSLYAAKDGTLWMTYFSNRLDLEQLSSGGYQLFLTHSADGRKWSIPRPLRMPSSGSPGGPVQMTTGPDGKFWMFHNLLFAAAESPDKIDAFQPLEIGGDENLHSHARNSHATLAEDGSVHLVWDNFGQKLFYSCRNPAGKWSRAVELPIAGGQVYRPHLLVQGDNALLLYAHQGAMLCRARITRAGLDILPADVAAPMKITDHVASLNSVFSPTAVNRRLVLLCGQDTIWIRTANEDELFKQMFAEN